MLRVSSLRAAPLPQRVVRILDAELLPLILSWLVLACVVVLTGFTLYMTFIPGLPTEPGWTLDHWLSIFNLYIFTKVIPNTLIVGVGGVLVTLLFAVPLSWLLNRTRLPFRKVFLTLIALVAIVPPFITAIGWIMLLNERIGLVNKALAALVGVQSVPLNVANPWGMAWITGLMLTPTMVFLISGPMQMIDPSLEEAAAVSGANPWQGLLRVSLPLVWPAILGGTIYNFMTAVSIFEVPALLGAAGGQSPVLATELFYAVHPVASQTATQISYGTAGVYATLIGSLGLLGLYSYLRVLASARRYAVITGKGYRPRLMELGRAKYLAIGFISLYLLFAVGLPVLVLLWASLVPVLQLPSAEALSKLSFNNYQRFLSTLDAGVVSNSIALVASVSLLVLGFSFMISWCVVRTQFRLRGLMDSLALLPHAIPGLAFAFALFMVGLLITRSLPWLALSGTLALVVIANLLNRLAYGTRITNAALLQVHEELLECAQVCGARKLETVWRVVVPLVRPSLVFAGVLTALLTFREVTMALFLTGTQNKVVSVAVWQLWTSGHLGIAAAGAVGMMVVMGATVLVVLAIGGGRGIAEEQAVLTSDGAGRGK